MSRVLLGTGMVVAAWALAVTGLVFAGDAEADAAWLKSGPGSAGAKAIRLGTPSQPVVDSTVCSGGNGYSITLHWSSTGDFPPAFEVFAAPKNGNSTLIATTANTSVSVSNLGSKPAVVSVRATAGTWRSAFSPEANGC